MRIEHSKQAPYAYPVIYRHRSGNFALVRTDLTGVWLNTLKPLNLSTGPYQLDEFEQYTGSVTLTNTFCAL